MEAFTEEELALIEKARAQRKEAAALAAAEGSKPEEPARSADDGPARSADDGPPAAVAGDAKAERCHRHPADPERLLRAVGEGA